MEIERRAFFDCSSLESITLLDSVRRISDGALADCTCLEHITIPDCVTEIMRSAFAGCTSLKGTTIPFKRLHSEVHIYIYTYIYTYNYLNCLHVVKGCEASPLSTFKRGYIQSKSLSYLIL